MSAVNSVVSGVSSALGADQSGGADFQQFMKNWIQNSLMSAMGDVQSMEQKHSQALEEQRENDNGPG